MNLIETLGIKTESCTAEKVILTLAVSDQLKQPYGVVHGGINATLAETAASMGANKWLEKNQSNQIAAGSSISTDHLRSVYSGDLKAFASPLKTGKRLQVWQVKIFNHDLLTSISTVTLVNINNPRT